MPCDNRLLKRDDLVRTKVRMEVGLRLGEEDDGAVCSSTRELAARLSRGRERDSIVEGQTKRLVGLLGTLVVEEILDDVVPDGEEGAARRVGRGVDAIRACDTASEGS